MADSPRMEGPERQGPTAEYPPRDLGFLAMNLAVKSMPTRWKFCGNNILLRTAIGDSAPTDVPEPYRWMWAGPEEIDFMDRHPEATSRSAYARRAARGDRCLCIKLGSELAGYRWVTFRAACILCGFSPKREIVLFPLKPGQAFSYDLYTYEKYRSRGVAFMLNNLLFQALREQGIKEILGLVSPLNRAALRAHLRLGAQPQCMAYSYRIRSWSKTFLGPAGDPRLIDWIERFKSGAGLD